jgi:hypothetical protein
MHSPYAPSSIILGMGDGVTVSLGIQNGQINYVSSNKCTIVCGMGEFFDIVRVTKDLTVIKAHHGFMFTGNFRHAGVRNVARNGFESDLLDHFNQKMSSTLDSESWSSPNQRNAAVVEMLCNFPGLNKLCRFHCTTEILKSKMRPPLDTVGFVDCLPNPPRYKGNRGPDVKQRATRSCQLCIQVHNNSYAAQQCKGRNNCQR